VQILLHSPLSANCQCSDAVITAQMRRLGSELQRQAKIVDQLDATSQGGSCSAKQLQQLQKELHRLDLQSSELKTQVQAELQAQQLLKRLSGKAALLCTQYAKLCVCVSVCVCVCV